MSDIERLLISNTSKDIGGGKFQPMKTFEVCTMDKYPNGKGWCAAKYEIVNEITLDEWERKNGTPDEKKGVRRWQQKYIDDIIKTYMNGALLEKNNLPGFI